MVITQRAGTYVTLLLGLALSGCGLFAPKDAPDPDPTPPIGLKPPTSPENVLNNLEYAYERHDIDVYREVMHDPDFKFLPSPGDPDIDFDQLSYDDDQLSTENMFDQVNDIELTLTYASSQPSDDETNYPPEEGYRKIEVTAVDLRVVTRQGTAGDPLILVVNGDPARFVFKPDSSQTPVTFKIVLQQDNS